MLDQTTLNDYDLLNLVRDNRLEPEEISKERWNLNFARSFLNRVYIKKIPKGVLSEEEQVQLYGHVSRAFYQLEEPCYRVCELAVKDSPPNLAKVPKKHRTKELCELSVEVAFNNWKTSTTKRDTSRWKMALGSIPKPLRTPELCLKAVQLDGKNLRSVPDLTDDLILKAIETTPMALKYVPEEFMNEDLIEKATRNNGRVLRFIPKKFQTPEVLKKTIRKSPFSIEWVENPSEEICLLAVNRDPESIRKISNPTEKVILTALEKDALLLLSCPHIQTNKRFREFGKKEFERSVSRFEYFQEKIKTPKQSFSEDLNLLSAFNTKDFLEKMDRLDSLEQLILLQNTRGDQEDIPHERWAYWVNKIIKKQDWNKQEIPSWLNALSLDRAYSFNESISLVSINEQLKRLEEDGMQLRHIQNIDQTLPTVQTALTQNGLALQFVDGRFKSSRLCRLAVANCPEAKYYSPYHIGI